MTPHQVALALPDALRRCTRFRQRSLLHRIVNRAPRKGEASCWEDDDFSACAVASDQTIYKVPGQLGNDTNHAITILHEMMHVLLYNTRPSLWQDEDLVEGLAQGLYELLTTMK